MAEIGISIYPSKSSFEDMKTYVDIAAKIGYTRIFTSMLEVADNPKETVNDFKKIIHYAKNLGMKTSIDVNPHLFETLQVSYDDLGLFKDMGVWSIRLDEGFTGAEEARMSMNPYDLVIELNISRGQHYIDMIMDFGADRNHVIGSHNFYPQAYTGLDFDYFVACAKRYKAYNLKTTAFVDSQASTVGPWPFSNLMVSTEVQRNMPITAQIQLLKLCGVIDDIFISGSLLPTIELQQAYEAFKACKVVLETEQIGHNSDIETAILYEKNHYYRGDYSSFMIRSSQPRVTYKNESIPAKTSPTMSERGDITICNEKSGQYKGELQITLKPHPNDGSQNLVAKVAESNLILLDLMKPWQNFEFSFLSKEE